MDKKPYGFFGWQSSNFWAYDGLVLMSGNE